MVKTHPVHTSVQSSGTYPYIAYIGGGGIPSPQGEVSMHDVTTHIVPLLFCSTPYLSQVVHRQKDQTEAQRN